MKPFAYVVPSSLEEACAALTASDGPVRALAGGTDLLVQMKRGKLRPNTLVSLKGIPGLNFARLAKDGRLAIGAATPLALVETLPEVKEHYPSVAEAAGWVGSVQVRSRATVGGNLCNAAPSADMAPILIAYGAVATITDGRGERAVPLEEFFVGPGQSILRAGELLTTITVPYAPPRSFARYERAYRSGIDIATAAVGMLLSFVADSTVVRDARIVLGAVAPTPMRARVSEELLTGHSLNEALIARVSARAAQEAKPISDVRASEGYRRVLVEQVSRKALTAARSWAEKGAGG